MKISIIVPTYNCDKFIVRCLTSILENGYRDLEVIVVDGCSNDRTLDIVKYFENKYYNLRLISEKDRGEPDAINKGMKLATGDIIAYLDADDVYSKGCFETINNYFLSHSNMWVYSKCWIINEDDIETRKLVTQFKEKFQNNYSYSTLLMFDYIAQPSVFWRRQIVEEIGYFDVNNKLTFDYDYWLRIGKKYKAGFINEYLASWRSHDKSETAKALAKDMRDGLDLSIRYSKYQLYLRPFQYAIYWLALLGYKKMGAL